MTCLREVMATKKATFQDRNYRGQLCNGSNGGPIRLVSTMLRFQAGAGGTLGGITLLRPSMNALMTGILNSDKCCLFCR